MTHRTSTSRRHQRRRRTGAAGRLALSAALALLAMFTVTTTATAQHEAPAFATNDDVPDPAPHTAEATEATGEATHPPTAEPGQGALDERERGHAGAAADAASREATPIDRDVPWQPGQLVPPGYTVGGAYRHDRGRRMVIAGGTLLGASVVMATVGAAYITRSRSSDGLNFDDAIGGSNMISGGSLALVGIGTLTRGLRHQRVARMEALHYGDHPHVARLDRFAPHSVPGDDWDRWRELRRQGTTLTAVGGTTTAAGWIVAVSAIIAASRDCDVEGQIRRAACGVDGTVGALIGASGALLAAGIPMTIVGADRLREARRLDAGGSVRTLHLSLSPATSAGAWGSQVQVAF